MDHQVGYTTIALSSKYQTLVLQVAVLPLHKASRLSVPTLHLLNGRFSYLCLFFSMAKY